MNMEECLICGAPLEYLERDEEMECAVCHRKEPSKTRCVNGHYVCGDCHTQGMDSIFGLCLTETSADPIAIVRKMMDLPFCHMHGPEHHVMVGAALLTAYKNAGGQLDLEDALREMYSRGKSVPGGACGFWGACGAGISAGQFLAIATASTPLAVEPWGLSNQMTARALDSIGQVGGPRCCKRDSFLSILAAVDFAREHLGVEMAGTVPVCSYSVRDGSIEHMPRRYDLYMVTTDAAPSRRQIEQNPRWPLSASTTPAAARWPRPWAESWPETYLRASPPGRRGRRRSTPMRCG
mgnify:CR=1 FL=1